jgi:hypothetical protein
MGCVRVLRSLRGALQRHCAIDQLPLRLPCRIYSGTAFRCEPSVPLALGWLRVILSNVTFQAVSPYARRHIMHHSSLPYILLQKNAITSGEGVAGVWYCVSP